MKRLEEAEKQNASKMQPMQMRCRGVVLEDADRKAEQGQQCIFQVLRQQHHAGRNMLHTTARASRSKSLVKQEHREAQQEQHKAAGATQSSSKSNTKQRKEQEQQPQAASGKQHGRRNQREGANILQHISKVRVKMGVME